MYFKEDKWALWVCVWNQGGGGMKNFGNHWSKWCLPGWTYGRSGWVGRIFRKASYSMGTQFLSPRVKRPGREFKHSPPFSAEVKEWMELYLSLPICHFGVESEKTNTMLVKSRYYDDPHYVIFSCLISLVKALSSSSFSPSYFQTPKSLADRTSLKSTKNWILLFEKILLHFKAKPFKVNLDSCTLALKMEVPCSSGTFTFTYKSAWCQSSEILISNS
jgi:hypothetical protein